MKEFRKILIAGFILLALAIAVSYKKKKTYEDSVAEEEAQKLVQIDLETVSKILVKNKNGEVVFAKRVKKGDHFQDDFDFMTAEFDTLPDWRIESPIKGLPDFYQINNLLNTLKGFSQTKVVDETGERNSEYGLEEGGARVDFYKKASSDKPDFTLWIGEENSAASGLYARTSASPKAYLANFTLRYLRDRKLDEWRKKEVIGIKELKNVQTLKIAYDEGKGSRVLELKKEKAKWVFTKPMKAPADFKAVEDFLSEVKSLRANKILSENAEKDEQEYGFDKPFLEVSFTVDEDGKLREKKIFMGSKIEPDKDLFVRRGALPQVFSVRPGMKNSLTTRFEDLVSKNPFTLRRSLVKNLYLKRDASEIELNQEDGSFLLKKPAKDSTDPGLVAALFDSLLNLKGRKYVPKTPSGSFWGEIGMEGDSRKEKLLLRQVGEEVFGEVQESGLVFTFEKAKLEGLFQSASDLRERRLIAKGSSELASMTLKKGKLKSTFVHSEAASWALGDLQSENEKLRAKLQDPEMAKKIVAAALDLRAESFSKSAKPSKVELELEFLPKTGEPMKWIFENLDEEKVLAYSEKRGITIELSSKSVKALLRYFDLEEKEES